MNRIAFSLCLFLLPCILFGQQTTCPLYQSYIEKGEAELKKGDKADFKKAIEAFSNAMIHCPAKADEARSKIVKAFDAINALKVRADQAKKEAETAKEKTEMALQQVKSEKEKAEKAEALAQQRANEAEIAKKKAEVALRQVDSAKQQVEAVIDKIYFYKDKFGLASQRDMFGNAKYGFIDKELNIKIDFKYEQATPFDVDDFSIVRWDYEFYLIDTLGNEYKLSSNISQLDSTITALDLRNKGLDSIPASVFQHTQLKVLLLGGNALKKLPKDISNLRNLLFLNLRYNYSAFSPEFEFEPTNRIEYLPTEIKELILLKNLNLDGNPINKEEQEKIKKLLPNCEVIF